AAASVQGRVAVEDLLPAPPLGHANPVVVARDGSEVADNEQLVVSRLPLAQETDHALLGVVAVDPLKPRLFTIELVQGRLAAVEGVEVAHPALHALVGGLLKQVPV